MKTLLRTSLAAFAFSSALAGAAIPSLANGFYPGIDPHHPPGTQNRIIVVPRAVSPYYVEPAPAGSVYVDTMPTGSIYVDPGPMGPIYVRPAPIYNLSPSEIRERHLNEYQAGGEGDYYQGIIPPAPVP
ncbi:hypothetical protein [Ensifer sp. LCM 4579]|uniref:hypothetical protein n=1 Tax=Ensifer sp. LCM 4579 TaxID=1848292 RepID=UPI0008D8F032|nr:hypothetical protein [Ensifer sp. LCM 4579]OHV78104.1 hypothetical protein LCM4579_07165 [Ensifer sp. LCM 4579]